MVLGMHGRKPESEVGRAFRCNILPWGDLVDYCFDVAPEITRKFKGWWKTTKTVGLGKRDSKRLAQKLTQEIRSGSAEAEIGVPRDPVWHPFSVEHVAVFAEFLEQCGGFMIDSIE
jgi:hypothetical protein